MSDKFSGDRKKALDTLWHSVIYPSMVEPGNQHYYFWCPRKSRSKSNSKSQSKFYSQHPNVLVLLVKLAKVAAFSIGAWQTPIRLQLLTMVIYQWPATTWRSTCHSSLRQTFLWNPSPEDGDKQEAHFPSWKEHSLYPICFLAHDPPISSS